MYSPPGSSSRGENIVDLNNRRALAAAGDDVSPQPDYRGVGSPELQFANAKLHQGPDGELALGSEGDDDEIDTSIYEWREDRKGSRWHLLTEKRLRGVAQNWLRTFEPDKVSKAMPASCIGTLVDLMVDENRFKPSYGQMNIVPLRNAYLVIEDDGSIRCVEPDRNYGVDYVIAADLDMSRVDPETKIYTPAPATLGGYWSNYITSTLPDEEVRSYTQQALSSVLLSKCYEKGIWLYGEGENGKSVMIHLLGCLAPRHTATINLKRLVKDQFGKAQLLNKRIVQVSEMPSRLNRDMQTELKGLISWDPTPIEKKGRDEFRFVPHAVWVFATNHHPEISDHEHGFWRKIETLPFTQRVAKGTKVEGLHEMISSSPAEMGQFIDWLLMGASRLCKDGWMKEKPKAIADLVEIQRREVDTVAEWLHTVELRYEPRAWTTKEEIYQEYASHVSGRNKHPLADNKFWGRVKEHFREMGLDTVGLQKSKSGLDRRPYCVQLKLEGVSPLVWDAAKSASKGQASDSEADAIEEQGKGQSAPGMMAKVVEITSCDFAAMFPRVSPSDDIFKA